MRGLNISVVAFDNDVSVSYDCVHGIAYADTVLWAKSAILAITNVILSAARVVLPVICAGFAQMRYNCAHNCKYTYTYTYTKYYSRIECPPLLASCSM